MQTVQNHLYIYIYGPGRRPATPPSMVSPPDTHPQDPSPYIHTYIHTCIHRYIHTCLYLPTYVGTYILHPTHPTGRGGEAEVPRVIVGFQGGSTPNPRNHPHRMHACMHTYIHTYIHTCVHTYMHAYIHTYVRTYIHTYVPIPTNLRRYIDTTPNPPHTGGGEACMHLA